MEVGCGTGVLLSELQSRTQGLSYGVDLDSSSLHHAQEHARGARLAQADGAALPFPGQTFDLALCHFLLLWVSNPEQVLVEMARVTRLGGFVLALAEPDYGGRIDHPDELVILGRWQQDSLEKQGADPRIGRKLAEIFHRAGLNEVEAGVLGGQWRGEPSRPEWELEWAVLESDLNEVERLSSLRALDWTARERGERVLFVPTFYAWGKVGQ